MQAERVARRLIGKRHGAAKLNNPARTLVPPLHPELLGRDDFPGPRRFCP